MELKVTPINVFSLTLKKGDSHFCKKTVLKMFAKFPPKNL